MGTAQDRLKRAFNILARNKIEEVDLYGELAKTEALINGLGSMDLMQNVNVPQTPMPQTDAMQQSAQPVNTPILQ